MNKPFSLRIFVADGDPDGLRVVERSNWIGKALMFPRALLPRVKERDELKQMGVYLLIGPREDGEGDLRTSVRATRCARDWSVITLTRISGPTRSASSPRRASSTRHMCSFSKPT